MTDDAIVTTENGRTVLRFERLLPHPVERVWRALTEPSELSGWLAEAKLDPVEGGQVELRWLNSDDEGNTAVARGTVTRFEPPRVLEFDTDIHGRLRWELDPAPTGSRLVFTVAHDLAPEWLAKVLAGWHSHLDFLADALDGRPVDWPNWPRDRWDRHHERYQRS
jgi:uncharacterized protein YndB with AHSA1/START domain